MQATIRWSMASVSLVAMLLGASPVGAQSPSAPVSQSPGPSAVPSSPAASPAPSVGPAHPSDSVLTCPTPGDPAAPASSAQPAKIKAAPAARSLGQWAGTWEPMPAAPIVARAGAATGVSPYTDAFVVWSGHATDGSLLWDGAVYHADTTTWEPVAASPLAPRTQFGFQVGGRGSFVIWGGVAADGTPLADGAYSLVTADQFDGHGDWLPVLEGPLPAGPANASGDVMNWVYVSASGTDPAAGPQFAFMMGQGEGWAAPSLPLSRKVAVDPPPVPVGVGYEVVTPDTDAPIYLSYQADGTAVTSVYDVLDGWTRARSVPLPSSGACPAIDKPWIGWVRADASGAPVGLLVKAGGGGWRSTATPPAEALTDGMLLWSPGRLIVADALLAYDLGTDRWLRLPDLPDGPRTGVSAAWTRGRLYVWGGRGADGAVTDTGWVFTPRLEGGTFALPGGGRGGYGDCGGEPVPTSIRLQADKADPELVWFQGRGERYKALWPDGYTVTFRARAVVKDPVGRVVAREGDRLRDITLGYCPYNGIIDF